MSSAVSMIGPKFYAWDSHTGNPLAFGKVYTYAAGTNTPKPTYRSEDAVTENTNPVILNGAGYADIYLRGRYKIVVKDQNDVEVWTSDPVSDATSLLEPWIHETFATQVSPNQFKVTGNKTDIFRYGRAVKLDDTVTFYGTVVSSTYLSGETRVTIDAVDDLTSDLSRAWASLVDLESLLPVLKDEAGVALVDAVTASLATFQPRMEERFNRLLANTGYEFVNGYQGGIELTEYNQVVRDASGNLWRAASTTPLPYTTTGTGVPEGGALASVGDAVIRNDLISDPSTGQGAILVRGSVIYVDTIADLQALPTSEMVDGQQAQVTGIGLFKYSDASNSFVNSEISNLEGVLADGSNLINSANNADVKTVLTQCDLTLASEEAVTLSEGKEISGYGWHSNGTALRPSAPVFIQNTAGGNNNLVSGMNLLGTGVLNGQKMIALNNARSTRVSDLKVSSVDVGIEQAGGWNNSYTNIIAADCNYGIKCEPGGSLPNWSGSNMLVVSSYFSTGRAEDTVGIDDGYMWNATYINPVFEFCRTPYKQNVSGSQTCMINPWFEANTNPPAFRRDTLVIGGRNVSFEDVSLYEPDNAITHLNKGIRVFNSDPDLSSIHVDGKGVKQFRGSLSDIGFTAYYIDDGSGKKETYEGVRIKDSYQYSNRGIFGAGRSSTDSEEARNLVLQGYGSYYFGELESDYVEPGLAATEIVLGGRNLAGSVSYYGEIHFGAQNVARGASAPAGPPPSVVKINEAGILSSVDNTAQIGSAGNRFSEVYAGTGTINTSDVREKEQQRDLSTAEQSVAVRLKSLIKMYRWCEAVERKGDGARWHIGAMAQDVGAAFESEGLNPHDYGVFCYDEWGVEDEDGVLTEKEGDRYGLRYDQLLAFIITAL